MKFFQTTGRLVMATMALCLAFATAGAQVPEQVDAWMTMLDETEVKTLTDGDIKKLLATMTDMQALGDDLDADSADFYGGVKENAAAMSILAKNGYDLPEFQQVMNNVVMAMGALEMENQRAEIDQSLAQLEAMKEQLPAATYDAMYQQVTGALAIFDKAPEGNIRLVEKYREEIEAIGDE